MKPLRVGSLFAAFLLLFPLFPTGAAERPNVVVILSDDLGYGSVGCYGADPALVRTPNIDRLAREGRRFTDANTTSSVCSPTRYSVLTGRYCWRTPLQSEVLSTLAPLHIETTRLTLASMLHSLGYRSAAIGKWHLGYGTEQRCDYSKELKPGPLEIGFDYHFSVPSNHGDIAGVYIEDHWVHGLNRQSPTDPSPPYVTMAEQKGKTVKTLALNAPKRVDDEVMPVLTDRAVEWLGRQTKDRPFFLYFTPVAVHNPVTPSKSTAGSSAAGPFGDWIHELDASVGRVLDALDKAGLADNTIVLFSSDNGGVNIPNRDCVQTQAQKAGLKPVGPFRGGKHNVWEGGFRVPYIVRWPGHVPAGTTCGETVSLVDTLASVAAVTGYALPKAAEAAEDSFDISRAWLGAKYEGTLRPDLIVHSADGNFAIRKGPWKWIEGVPADDVKPAARKAHADEFKRQLYNLGKDIAETTEVSARNEGVVREMEALLNRYRDGGYSRELPPAGTKPAAAASLPPLAGEKVVDEPMVRLPGKPWAVTRGEWTARDGAVWGAQKKGDDQAAALRGPLAMGDGALEFELRPGEADRLSVRIHTADNKRSFRVVVGGGHVEIAKNPDPGEGQDKTVQLARERIKLKREAWHLLRISFKGDEITAQIAGVTAKARHEVFAQPRGVFNLLVFDGEIGFRNLRVVK